MKIKDPQLAEKVAAWQETHRCGPGKVERRLTPGEVRIDFEIKDHPIIGYAAVFNQETELWPGFREKVAPGAFSKTIQSEDVRGGAATEEWRR